MERISHWLAWIAVFVIVVFSGLNWSALTAPTAINLLLLDVHAPLGLILLGLTAVFVALFFVASLYSRISNLLESRQLNKELQRVQEVANRAEASRMDTMQQMMLSEFRLLNDRLTKLESLIDVPLVKLP